MERAPDAVESYPQSFAKVTIPKKIVNVVMNPVTRIKDSLRHSSWLVLGLEQTQGRFPNAKRISRMRSVYRRTHTAWNESQHLKGYIADGSVGIPKWESPSHSYFFWTMAIS